MTASRFYYWNSDARRIEEVQGAEDGGFLYFVDDTLTRARTHLYGETRAKCAEAVRFFLGRRLTQLGDEVKDLQTVLEQVNRQA